MLQQQVLMSGKHVGKSYNSDISLLKVLHEANLHIHALLLYDLINLGEGV